MHAQIFLFSGKLFQPTLFKKSFRFFQKIIQHIPKWTFIKRNKINLPTFPFYVKVEELQQINCCVLLFLFILLFLISRHWKRFSSFLESALFFVAHSSLSLSLFSRTQTHLGYLFLLTLLLQSSNMAQMKLSLSVSLFLTLLLLSPSSFAKVSISSKLASKQAEKLIHELNLFPKESDNIVDRDPFPTAASRIVEKRFNFANLTNSSVISFEDLGHHAGYYKIKHSHAARYLFKP